MQNKVEYLRKWRKANREKVNAQERKRYAQNKEKERAQQKEYYQKNKEKEAERKRQYYLKNKDKIKATTKKYKKDNKEKISKRNKKYYQENKKQIQEYASKNRKSISKKEKERKKADINFKIKKSLRTRTWQVMKGKTKIGKMLELLGCTIDFLKKHIESQFKKEMNWSNYGKRGWTIDHIIPCASFDLSREDEQKKCFHYSNLQPLWFFENSEKSAKII